MNLARQRLLCLRLGIQGRCPRCGRRGLFKTRFRLYHHCPHCELPLENEDGWSLGSVPLSYTFTCLFWVLPMALAFMAGVLSLTLALILAGIGCLVWPILLYRTFKSMWVGVYYAVLPHELNGNKKTRSS